MILKPLKLVSIQMADLDSVLALDQLCFGGFWTRIGYQKEIENHNSDFIGLIEVVESGSKLIGMACLWAILEEAHIILLGVHPDYQGKKLGSLLLLSLLQKAGNRSLEWATLEVKASNEVALSLYQKFGFVEVGIRPKYYPNNEDAILLWKKGLQDLSLSEYYSEKFGDVIQNLKNYGWNLLLSEEKVG